MSWVGETRPSGRPADDGIAARADDRVTPSPRVKHRDDEFNQAQLEIYAQIEPRHFWFAGRRRFVLRALRRAWPRLGTDQSAPSAIDLGAGCGGWIAYLAAQMPGQFSELAIADSSLRALELARATVGPRVARYHVDLRRLEWSNRWDVVFLLDVLEHISDDRLVMREVARALRPGGLLFLTAPALEALRTSNDEIEHHVRRYSRRDFQVLADASGLRLADARYFMFFLSPLLLASRLVGPNVKRLAPDERLRHYARTHRLPCRPINACLRAIFSAETPLGHWLPFPWGTSVLGILQKPC